MNARKISFITLTVILIVAVFAGVANAWDAQPEPIRRAVLSNVRDYSPAHTTNGSYYAVDGGVLFAGSPTGWLQVITPKNVIASSVATDKKNPNTIYIGAANEMAIYRSLDAGKKWLRVQLTSDSLGGVTDIAVDSVQRLVYAGTDSAGLFRLRDIGSSLLLTGQLLTEEPILEVAADNTGQALAYARTEWHLYRAENYGMTWVTVDNLGSVATAVQIADTIPATVYVGTVDRGVLESKDGAVWTTANHGLGRVPGSRLHIDALAVDPAQPNMLYVATSYLYGTTEIHSAPVGVAMSVDGANAWSSVVQDRTNIVAELLPVGGKTGAVYALTTTSRTPLALGSAPSVAAASVEPVAVTQTNLTSNIAAGLTWTFAALAALALAYAGISDLYSRWPLPRKKPVLAMARS